LTSLPLDAASRSVDSSVRVVFGDSSTNARERGASFRSSAAARPTSTFFSKTPVVPIAQNG